MWRRCVSARQIPARLTPHVTNHDRMRKRRYGWRVALVKPWKCRTSRQSVLRWISTRPATHICELYVGRIAFAYRRGGECVRTRIVMRSQFERGVVMRVVHKAMVCSRSFVRVRLHHKNNRQSLINGRRSHDSSKQAICHNVNTEQMDRFMLTVPTVRVFNSRMSKLKEF